MGGTLFVNPLYEPNRIKEDADMKFPKNNTSGTLPKEDNELTLDLFSRGSLSTNQAYGCGRQDVLEEEDDQGYLSFDMACVLLAPRHDEDCYVYTNNQLAYNIIIRRSLSLQSVSDTVVQEIQKILLTD
ncbi:hypothetical protein RND71_002172 [Anisodus tanguticus]|uniref:Uncharacterized protein n=1 Tax=Anisodus tanguticus TaxID=243964 RepID=A0AAE1T1F8_9SOLA|nr:hypothetical protein RND71_002172 [Anisodus tanguticus]